MNIITTKLPTKKGEFNFSVIKSDKNEIVFLTTKKFNPNKEILLRIHSECMTGDIFHSLKCDCGEQLDKSLKLLNESKNGLLIYLRQEGRGIGLFNKIRTYKIQEKGVDTHQANIEIDRKPDEREYSEAIKILNFLNVKKVNLLTNNPDKVKALEMSRITLNSVIPLEIKPSEFSKKYIETKKKKFKHYFNKNDLTTYIGISGIYSVEDIYLVFNNIEQTNKIIYLGINANETNLSKVIPLFSIKNKKGFKKILHFSFSQTKFPEKKIKEILKIKDLDGVQLNDLRKENTIKVIKLIPQELELILPICKDNLELIETEEFIKELKKRKIHFLIDNSKGKGIKSDFSEYQKYVLLLLNKNQNRISISGGIGPEHHKILFDLEEYFKFGFSVDAESKLKTNRKLDINKVKKYIEVIK